MKQTIAGDKTSKEKSRKAGTLLCAKKNPKKKKKKAPYNVAYNDGGYPLYATSTIDGNCCLAVVCILFMINSQQMHAREVNFILPANKNKYSVHIIFLLFYIPRKYGLSNRNTCSIF
jgi:hypothetical protein